MTELPQKLTPWAEQLKMFTPELALPVGEIAGRLAPALGPMRVTARAASGDVDGFDGITRRGSYERLLLTEWAISEASSDEFMRRASTGELSFLKLARTEPARAKRCVALFDSGPEQIGSPRLVHLALLILLAQRAEQARATFGWQLLQASTALMSSVTPQSVFALLTGRSSTDTSPDDVSRWREQLRSGPSPDELWVVGAKGVMLFHAARGVSQIEVTDVIEPGVARVHVQVRAQHRRAREVTVKLPNDRDCARLLRDPFSVLHAPVVRGGRLPISNLLFSPRENKLFGRTADNEVVSFPIPNSPRAGVGRPKVYCTPSRFPVLALGWVNRGILFATFSEKGEVVLESFKAHRSLGYRSAVVGAFAGEPPTDLQGEELGFLSQLPGKVTRPSYRFHCPGGALLDLRWAGNVDSGDAPLVVLPVAGHATCFEDFGDMRVFVARDTYTQPTDETDLPRHEDSDWKLVRHTVNQPPEVLRLLGNGTFAAYASRSPHSSHTVVAVNEHDSTWTILDGKTKTHLTPTHGSRAVGVLGMKDARESKLVVVEDDNQTVTATARGEARQLLRASVPISTISVGRQGTHIAYLTTDRKLVVYNLTFDKALLDLQIPEVTP